MRKINAGFTYAEIIVVIIILGILAGIAVPSFHKMINKAKKQEAEQVLLSIFGAQLDFRRDNGSYANDIALLDVEIPALKNYKDLEVADALTKTCNGVDKSYVAALTSKDDGYILYVLTDGKIVCDDCESTECKSLGYSSSW